MKPVDSSTDDEKAIRSPEGLIPGRITTADGDGCWSFVENFEVVRDEGTLVIIALSQLLVRPKLLSCLRTPVLHIEIFALDCKS